ncbi:hypothetical protein B9Z55_026798 [Caenorhabditis nigoni]|uniref:DUF38 domain-containing protein n=1 Tax=Caenorhabditis nigoni TaxID=1611254 RepID=A0A2G5SHU4_9PELO|nr:hypothetical protein B9Z55_026798 [Caenorhabditis nigoni]
MFVIYEEGEKEKSCVISKNPVKLIKTDEHFLDAFFNDFEHILENQKSKLTDLIIGMDSFTKSEGYISSPLSKFQSIFSHLLCYRFPKFEKVLTISALERNRQHTKNSSRMMAKFEAILKSRTVPLEVKNLRLTVFESQIFGILRFIRTKSLKGYRTLQFGLSEKKDTLALGSISKCETLKNMEYLGIYDFVMTNPISDFLNIPELLLIRGSISRDDILIIKQAFITNPRLKKWNLELGNSEGDEVIYEVLGRTFNGQPNKWFFETPNFKETLSIHYTKRPTYTNIVFTRINLIDVPKNALIRCE